jgi:WD40 repeat protein
MKRTSTLRGALLILVPGLAIAQSSQLSSPTLGYVFDPDGKAIRIIAGVPGAASLEGNLTLPFKLENAIVAAGRKYAIAENSDSDTLLLVTWPDGKAASRALEGAPKTATLMSFSTSGDIAAIYSRANNSVQIWKGLPADPSLLREMDSPAITALAISDDGALVAVTNDSGIQLLGGDQPRQLAPGGPYGALSFLKNSHDLAAADQQLNQIILIGRADTDAQLSTLAGAQDGIAQPIAVAFSLDGQKLVVANAANSSILVLDLNSRATSVLQLDRKPDGLYRAQGNAVFRLTSSLDDPIALMDGDADEPRLLSIPTGVAR